MMGRLSGKRIRVVEDEYFIARDLARAPASEGAVIIRPTGDVGAGLELVREEQIDGALLDVNLGRDVIYPLADQLTAGDVPWFFVTGYDSWSLPDAHKGAQLVSKPFSMPDLVDAVARLVEGGSSR